MSDRSRSVSNVRMVLTIFGASVLLFAWAWANVRFWDWLIGNEGLWTILPVLVTTAFAPMLAIAFGLTQLQARYDALMQHADAMAEALGECAGDLEDEVKARTDHLQGYPTYERKRERDLAPVAKARQALSAYTHWLIDGR